MENALKHLAEQLMSEPFAKVHRLGEKSLEEINSILDATQEKFERVAEYPGTDPELAENAPSYEKTKELYCLLLLKLEEHGLVADGFDSLTAIAESGTNTVFSHPIERKPTSPIEELPHTDWLKSPQFAEPIPEDRTDFFAHDDLPPLETEIEPRETKGEPHLFEAASERSKEYLAFATWVDGLQHNTTFDENFTHRLVSQNLCFALEAEGLQKLERFISNFWSHREAAVRGVLNLSSPRFELSIDLLAALTILSDKHSEWLYEGHFSQGGMLNSLRYMVGSKLEKFEPSLQEMAILLLLFGQNRLGGVPVKNYLELPGSIPEIQLVETAFRLMRIQKLKNRAIQVTSVFHPEHRALLEEDIRRVVELFNHIARPVGNERLKVA